MWQQGRQCGSVRSVSRARGELNRSGVHAGTCRYIHAGGSLGRVGMWVGRSGASGALSAVITLRTRAKDSKEAKPLACIKATRSKARRRKETQGASPWQAPLTLPTQHCTGTLQLPPIRPSAPKVTMSQSSHSHSAPHHHSSQPITTPAQNPPQTKPEAPPAPSPQQQAATTTLPPTIPAALQNVDYNFNWERHADDPTHDPFLASYFNVDQASVAKNRWIFLFKLAAIITADKTNGRPGPPAPLEWDRIVGHSDW
ncbi:uncharacterized protein EV422DRAFT_292074 [Fimicolochytrium jonesii]|uniref:uncharacterized protein n=1 Tax=Fimicolochytrium jonesii TaxID=1396493 RepID=UPI0022FDF0AF|nr:uncharacterized protein EV422DRAFT_292074 [Fimicolochytrium jonesii]KAI8816416.1 hypothetical protein EV422DRAFT_292074 [Fimicolochytrium jonesii]